MPVPGFDAGSFVQEGTARVDAQKAALMQVIAQSGAGGAQAYAQGQGEVAGYGQQALTQGANNARGSAVEGSQSFASGENGRMQAIQGMYQQDLATGAANFGADMARQEADAGTYMSEMAASLPAVAGNITSQAEAISARVAEKQKQMEQERQMAELQMQMQREEQQFRREDHAAKANGDKDDPMLAAKLRAADDEHAMNELAIGQTRNAQDFPRVYDEEFKKYGPRAREALTLLVGNKTVEEIRKDKNLATLNFDVLTASAARIRQAALAAGQ